jgi:ribosomal protein S18 acetylase RimI-like enzyme
MTVRDWRSLPRTEVEPWYRAEQAWWSNTLAWETSSNWTVVEQARTTGTLPGLVLYDGTRAAGWSFYLIHRSILQIGGLTAPTRAAAGELLDAILASPEAGRSHGAMIFVPIGQGWLSEVVAERGFSVRPFRYLVRALDGPVDRAPAGQPLAAARVSELTTLLSRAYPGADPARPFAPGGTWDEWADYTAQLVTQTGCGTLEPDCSVLEPREPGVPGLLGAVLTTRLAAHTGHLAQVAVDPGFQGQGIGARMVRTALARLRAHGYTRASLLVADDNLTAGRMYARLGFVETGRFLSASRPQPTRSTMAACSTGGLRTFR